MQCPGCGSDVSDNNRFCIYCGKKLSPTSKRMVAHSPRTPSGVMRLRRKADFSQTALPEIQQSAPKLKLASLSSSTFSTLPTQSKEDTDMPRPTQSPELKDLLSKLGNKSSAPAAQPSPPLGFVSGDFDDLDDDDDQDFVLGNSEDATSLDDLSLDDDISISLSAAPAARASLKDNSRTFGRLRTSSVSLQTRREDKSTDSLSIHTCAQPSGDNLSLGSMELENWANEENADVDDSDQIPMASGTFARTPSGGFKLALESVKSTCRDMLEKAQATFRHLGKRRSSANTASRSMTVTELKQQEKRRKLLAIAIVTVALIGVIGIVVSVSSPKAVTPEITSVATNDSNDFELVDLGDDGTPVAENDIPVFEPDEFSFDFSDTDLNLDAPAHAIVPAAQPQAVVAEPQAETTTPKQTAPASSAEARKYGRNDNLFIGTNAPETLKLKRSCVMREGPASRFPLVSELKPGQKVEILTTTDEDWVFQNGVWTKSGQANRLGPGTQFSEAQKGMSVAAPTSRVISAKNWRYVRAGKTYGYVGPACFK